MMQAIFETAFDFCYLIGMISLGILILHKGRGDKVLRLFGFMAILLGAGDAFHLLPRVYALWTTGLEANAAALGIGKLVTSITMTVFYLLLYHIWRMHYGIKGNRDLTCTIWGLAAIRIFFCLFPQNEWLSFHQPLFWSVLRNIPFAILGFFIILLFHREETSSENPTFRFLPLAVLLSFAFYIPVVLFAAEFPAIGMLMIPKTLAYVWIVYMGWQLCKQQAKPS